MAAKRVRWECPNGCAGVLGPTKPRRDNVCRYCLACSAKVGKLVERQAPALERQRTTAAERAKAKTQRKRDRARELELRKYGVEGVDLREVWKLALKLPSLQPAARHSRLSSLYRRRQQPKVTSGRTDGHDVHLSIGIDADAGSAVGVLLHELAHNACLAAREPWGDADRAFGRRCHDAIDEWNERHSSIVVVNPLGRGKAYAGAYGRRNRHRLEARRAASSDKA